MKGNGLLKYANNTTTKTSTTNVLLYLIIIQQGTNMSGLFGNIGGQGTQGGGGLFGTQTAPAAQSNGLFGGAQPTPGTGANLTNAGLFGGAVAQQTQNQPQASPVGKQMSQ